MNGERASPSGARLHELPEGHRAGIGAFDVHSRQRGAKRRSESGGRARAADLAGRCLRRVARATRRRSRRSTRATSGRLYGVVARILTAGDASGEALQEAYVRIWEKAGEFDPAKGSPLAWMATIARNRALDEVRRVRPASLEDMPEGFEPAADAVDPLARARGRRALTALIACLEGLDEEKRAVLMLAYYRGVEPRGAGEAVRQAGADDQDLAAPQPGAIEGMSGVMSSRPTTISPPPNSPSARSSRASARRSPRGGCASRSSTRRSAPGRRASRRSPRRRRRSSRPQTSCRRSRRASGGAAGPRAAPPRTPRSRRCAERAWRAGAPRRSPRGRRGAAGDRFGRARGDARAAPARICRDPAEETPNSPAFEVTVDLDRQELSVRPVAAPAPPGKSYELWLIDPKLGAPRSLGVDRRGPRARRARRLTLAP